MRVFYRDEYTIAAHSFDTTRKAGWVAESLRKRPIPGIEFAAPEFLSEAQLVRYHEPRYVAAVRTGQPASLASSQGFDWDPGLWVGACASNGGAVAAALEAAEGQVAGSLSSGLHHASRDSGNGFCTFNGLAIAAHEALTARATCVLIVDLDAHCGGGTHSMIAAEPRIRQLDVSVDAFDAYEPVDANTLDLVTTAAEYLPTIRRRLDAERGPLDLVLYNAGMDPYEGCAVGGLVGVNSQMLADREALVFDWCRSRSLPVAFVLAGGYVGSRLSQQQLVELHRLTIAAALQAH